MVTLYFFSLLSPTATGKKMPSVRLAIHFICAGCVILSEVVVHAGYNTYILYVRGVVVAVGYGELPL